MSLSLDILFNYPNKEELMSKLSRELGVKLCDVSCDAHPYSAEFRFSATQFELSTSDTDLKGSGVCNDTFEFKISCEVPSENEIGSFSLVFSTLLKTVFYDLLIGDGLLVFSSQTALARLKETNMGLFDQLTNEQIFFSDLPTRLENWLSKTIASLAP